MGKKTERLSQKPGVKLLLDSMLPGGQREKGNWVLCRVSLSSAGCFDPWFPDGRAQGSLPHNEWDSPFERALKWESAPNGRGTGACGLRGSLGLIQIVPGLEAGALLVSVGKGIWGDDCSAPGPGAA